MFENLRVALAIRNLTLKDLSNLTKVRYDTLLRKYNGKAEFLRSEMVSIKKALHLIKPFDGDDGTLDMLFERQDQAG